MRERSLEPTLSLSISHSHIWPEALTTSKVLFVTPHKSTCTRKHTHTMCWLCIIDEHSGRGNDERDQRAIASNLAFGRPFATTLARVYACMYMRMCVGRVCVGVFTMLRVAGGGEQMCERCRETKAGGGADGRSILLRCFE